MLTRLVFLLGCSGFVLTGQEILVAAAADLSPMERALVQATGARFVFGSSGMLARQIRSGAPYDVYLSANEEFVKQLAGDGLLLDGTVQTYAVGRLGLWSPGGKAASLEDLARKMVRYVAIANPEHAPYGLAAQQLLSSQGLWDKVKSKLVLGENVRQAFEFARTGNADAVITSWSLLKGELGAVLLPSDGHAPIRQSGGVVRGTKNEKAARALMEFLKSAGGRKILTEGGLSSVQ